MKENLIQRNDLGWIDDYSRAVKKFTLDHDPSSHIPFDAFRFYPLYFEAWMDKILVALNRIEEKKIGNDNVAKMMPALGSLRFVFYSLVNVATFLDYDKESAKRIFDFFIAVMKKKSVEKDIFLEDRVIIRRKDEIGRIVEDCKEVESEKERSLVAKLTGSLVMYSHALYNDYSSEYGYAVDGPYQTQDRTLIVRNFCDLRPVELWPETKDVKFSQIRIDTVYSKTNFKMRFVSNHLLSGTNFIKKTKKYRILVDDKEVTDLKQIEGIVGQSANLVEKIYLKQNEANFEKIKLKFLKQQGYELRNLFALAGLDWKPGKEIISKIKDKELLDEGMIQLPFPKTHKEYEDYIGVSYLREVYR